ncbi:N-methyl-D-aspartate receptor glutamate-binding subunit [Handroanthus impetiginosus]|uniref:N-methyl-D-aspartate receptor glutamate-binding subunit n=1 Tax=Handroanthus impetiginosus TaxID=429701 RepID=A0A2G9GQM6_9LAMI|nr:N-methyl-D-aspartate receptor glutamate-binding subunit [Handroanthus impetiginosus]
MGKFFNRNNDDIEMGRGQLYPGMQENPQLRWGFIRKVYSILALQLLISFVVALAMNLIKPIRVFMHTVNGLYVMIALMVLTIIFCLMMHCYSQRHPWNYILLLLFTVAMAGMIGAATTQRRGEAVLLAAGLTLLVTVALTLFTFFAAKRGYDFSFLGPFLLCALLVLIAFGIIRIIFPMGHIGNQVFACIGVLIFSGFIIYDTDNLIKRYDYDQYIAAAACLYLDIVNLFLDLLSLLGDE